MSIDPRASKQALHHHLRDSDAQRSYPEFALTPHRKAPKSFEATMAEITRPMPTHKRLFSKFIHLKAVSTLSDTLGFTLARPDALLSGGIFSFMLTLAIYVLAKNLGYTLSGFESIAAFLLGWTLGVVYDFLKLMITGKH